MARIRCLNIFVIVVISTVSLQETSAIKCWRCSSDGSNAGFCSDSFDPTSINYDQRRWSYVECTHPPGQLNPYSEASNQRAICKKVKQLVNGREIVQRSCFWEHAGAPKDACMKTVTPSFMEISFCETCDTDGCNGASQFGSNALLVAVPAAIAKFLLL